MQKKIYVLAVAAALLQPAAVLGETTDNAPAGAVVMKEVVVTATRDAEEMRFVPANVTVINPEDIQEAGASDISTLLEMKANIHVKSYNGNRSQAFIDLRGFGENGYGKTLVLLDGRRMNRVDMSGINWQQIPLQMIEKIEVVRGPGNVLYGDAAVAGVINIITKKGYDAQGINYTLQAGEHGSHAEQFGLLGNNGRYSYSLNAEVQHDDGWRNRSTFDTKGAGLNLAVDVNDSSSVSVGGSFVKMEFEMPGALTREEMTINRTQIQPARSWFIPLWGGYTNSTPAHFANEAENEYINGNLLFEKDMDRFGEFELQLVYGRKELTTDMVSGWLPSQYNILTLDTVGFTPKYIFNSNPAGLANKIITGIDYYRETLTVDQFLDQARSQKAWISEVEKESVGWYLHDEFTASNSLIISLGGRIESAAFEGDKVMLLGGGFGAAFPATKKTHQQNAFDAGITWLPSERVKFYGKISTVFRYPFTDEQVNYYGLNDGFNSGLEPESGRSVELGSHYSSTDNWGVGMTLFQIDMEDEITWDMVSNKNINLDQTRHRGLELETNIKPNDQVDLEVMYAYHLAESTNGVYKGKELPMVPNQHASVQLDYRPVENLHVISGIVFVDGAYLGNDFDNSSDALDSYTVVNCKVEYLVKLHGNPVKLFAGVSNLFDLEYETIGFENDPNNGGAPADTFYPAPGREFFGGISGSF